MLPQSEKVEEVLEAWESPISPSQKFENLLRTRTEDVHRPPPSSEWTVVKRKRRRDPFY